MLIIQYHRLIVINSKYPTIVKPNNAQKPSKEVSKYWRTKREKNILRFCLRHCWSPSTNFKYDINVQDTSIYLTLSIFYSWLITTANSLCIYLYMFFFFKKKKIFATTSRERKFYYYYLFNNKRLFQLKSIDGKGTTKIIRGCRDDEPSSHDGYGTDIELCNFDGCNSARNHVPFILMIFATPVLVGICNIVFSSSTRK